MKSEKNEATNAMISRNAIPDRSDYASIIISSKRITRRIETK